MCIRDRRIIHRSCHHPDEGHRHVVGNLIDLDGRPFDLLQPVHAFEIDDVRIGPLDSRRFEYAVQVEQQLVPCGRTGGIVDEPDHLLVVPVHEIDLESLDAHFGIVLAKLLHLFGEREVAEPEDQSHAPLFAVLHPVSYTHLLAAAGPLTGEVHVTAVTGSTGAGVKPSATTHFSWRTDNISVYKAFTHQHLIEIGRNLRRLQPGFGKAVNFVPMRGDFARGILASVYTDCPLDETAARRLYEDFYAPALFTHVAAGSVDLKQVVNTDKALLSVAKYDGKLHVVSVIDNLLKGASGQAVQNMNLMFGLDEGEGLRLKASAF